MIDRGGEGPQTERACFVVFTMYPPFHTPKNKSNRLEMMFLLREREINKDPRIQLGFEPKTF